MMRVASNSTLPGWRCGPELQALPKVLIDAQQSRCWGRCYSMLGADMVLGIASAPDAVASYPVAMGDRRKRATASAYHANVFNPFQPGEVRRAVNQGRARGNFWEEVPISVSVHATSFQGVQRMNVPVIRATRMRPPQTDEAISKASATPSATGRMIFMCCSCSIRRMALSPRPSRKSVASVIQHGGLACLSAFGGPLVPTVGHVSLPTLTCPVQRCTGGVRHPLYRIWAPARCPCRWCWLGRNITAR